jgi:single-strand DNA-binding protein
MANLNQCNFIGSLGKDPEQRFFPDGTAVCNFSIAVNETWKDKNGDKQERVTWIPIQATHKLAEICSQYLKKGSSVFVSGKFTTRKWQDKDGQDRYTTEIRADAMQMLGSKQDGGERSSAPARPAAQRQAAAPVGSGFDDMDDDIPF